MGWILAAAQHGPEVPARQRRWGGSRLQSSDLSSSSRASCSLLALIILNHDLPRSTQQLWDKAHLHICADGGANRLFQLERRLVPDYIVGDLDSIKPNVRDLYSLKGAKIIKSGDEDTTDLHKCVAFVSEYASKDVSDLQILVVGALGGRFDHEMGNINVLHLFRDLRIVFLNDDNLIFLLPKGFRHEIEALPGAHCGLIPLGRPSLSTTSSRLTWNLHESAMSFGSLVSTSNLTEGEVVTVVSDVDMLWTMELKQSSDLSL